MSDFFPDWTTSSEFLMPNVSESLASKFYTSDEVVQKQLQERQRRLQTASRAEIESMQEQERQRAEDFERNKYKQTDFNLIERIDEFIEKRCFDLRTVNLQTLDLSGACLIELESHQRQILRHIFNPVGNRLSKYTTIIWSEPEKSGKTQIASCVVAYFAEYVDPPNNILAIANKKDQAEGRIFRAAKPHLKGLNGNVPTSKTGKPVITMPNGTTISALPNSPATEAGDAYCLTAWSEIWAFKDENDERLFAELMPVETMRVSMQWIETYAGYIDESTTLARLFKKAYKDFDERELAQGARYVKELEHITTDNHPACIEVPEEELFIYWSHERRMPWQSEMKKQMEMKKLTKVEAVRLMENRWQSSSSELLEEAWIQASVRDRSLDAFKGMKFTLAVDAAMRHDNIALVGTFSQDEIYYTQFVEIYDPHGKDADLTELVENRVKQLYDEGLLATYLDDENVWRTPVYFDPFQLHTIRLNCIDYGIDVIEFNQGVMRAEADTMLYHLYREGRIVNPDRADFLDHVRGGKAKYLEGEKVRIIKGTTKDSKKIDALVAQSMSCHGTFLLNEVLSTQADLSSVLIQGSVEGRFAENKYK